MLATRVLGGWLLATAVAAPLASQPVDPGDEADAESTVDVARALEATFEAIAAAAEPSILSVRAFCHDPSWFAARMARAESDQGWKVSNEEDLLYDDHRPCGTGFSGFVVSDDGHAFTSHDAVVDPATGEVAPIVDVEFHDSEHRRAKVVATEPTIGLAILRIADRTRFEPLELANSSRATPGQWCVAMADPPGTPYTFVVGHVARQPSRDCYQDELSRTYLQTSCPLAPADEGGPLLNLDGEVIGMHTSPRHDGIDASLATSSGYALPINLATAIYKSLLFRQSQKSPWLGVSVLNLTPNRRQTIPDAPMMGVLIDNVYAPSPAATLGIEPGDILTRLDGETIATVYDFQRVLYQHGVGGNIEITVVRRGEELSLLGTIEVRPPEATTR